MRVTFVLPTLGLAGGLKVIAIYADALRRRGHEVSVVALPRRPISLKWTLRLLLKGKWESTQQVLARREADFRKLWADVRIIEKSRPIEDRDVPDADVVVATWWETAEWVHRLSPSKGAKVYFIQGYEAWENQPKARVDATWRLPLRKIVVSRFLANLSREQFGDASGAVVPNSVDLECFAAEPRAKQARFTVGFVYSDISIKGCDILLRALEILQARHPEMRVVSFGANYPSPWLPLPPTAEFHFQPDQARIPGLYASCDAWLFSSRQEGFGLPILEAMACGTPVIGTPAGAAPELLEGDRGILVPHDDVAALVEALERMRRMDDAAWRAMSSRAREGARGHTWEDAAGAFERLLLHAADSREGARA